MTFNILIAQLNLVVGDVAGNADRIRAAAAQAHADGMHLLVTPELSLCGYPPEDLLLRPAFLAACDQALQQLTQDLAAYPGLAVVVGHPSGSEVQRERSVQVPGHHNALSVLRDGQVIGSYHKQALPNYQVFDERRYFVPGQSPCVIDLEGWRIGFLICEDAWFPEPVRQTQAAGADAVVVINASPYHLGKGREREAAMAQRAREVGLPVVYAHQVGGQDELVFEGRSFLMNAQGVVCNRAPAFRACLWPMALSRADDGVVVAKVGDIIPADDGDAELWDALVTGVRDYVQKNRFPSVVLGLSGGIDSALVLAIAVDALGPERVRAVMMPSPYTADISWMDARDMAGRLGVRYDELSIVPMVDAFMRTLQAEFVGRVVDATEENIQARVRGTLLMALSNKFGSLVLTTGNKSELATGYCTLYGDMAGGFAVIKDLVKTTVYRLAAWRNRHDPHGRGAEPIPERIITRPPSAELRPDQTDQDSLPPYEVLDAILQRHVEEDHSADQLLAEGFSAADVARVLRLIQWNEYKRRQAPIGIRVTHRAFGKDWRYPITNRFPVLGPDTGVQLSTSTQPKS